MYLDLQVNGYGGVDFNGDDLSVENLAVACQRLRADGVRGILATIITDEIDTMCARLRRLVDGCEQSSEVAEMILGMHIEGPFLNEQPGYIGAHPATAAQPANLDGMKKLLEATSGRTKIVTLAPERDADYVVTRWLADQGIIVAAGHCNPSLDELKGSVAAGLSMFTHLGNGCPMEMHRCLHRASSLSRGTVAPRLPGGAVTLSRRLLTLSLAGATHSNTEVPGALRCT